MSMPKGWGSLGGRITSPRAAEDPPPPKKDPKEPVAADPVKCGKCGATVPTMDPPAKYCPSCGAGLDGAEKPAEGESAKATALGRHVLALTSSSSSDAARGVLEAWRGSHEQLVAVRGELVAARTQLESIERERVLEQAVRDRVIDPGLAWSFSTNEKGEKVRSFSAWAGPPYEGSDPKRQGEGQSLAQLKAFVSAQAKSPKAPDARPITPAPIAGVAALTEEQQAHCKRNGLNPEIYAERLAAEERKKGMHR